MTVKPHNRAGGRTLNVRCKKMKSIILTLAFYFASLAHSWTAPLPDWLGPDIAQLHFERGATGRECLSKIMDAIKSDQNSRVAVRVLVSDTELTSREIDGEMRLAKIPAMIALRYLADALRLHLTSDGIIWTLRENPGGPDDLTTRVFPKITIAELTKMGLNLQANGTVAVISGPRWPSEPLSRISVTGNTLIMMAWDSDIETFDAFLRLTRRGYVLPSINSEQEAGVDQPATKPADKVPAEVQPSIPTPKVVPR